MFYFFLEEIKHRQGFIKENSSVKGVKAKVSKYIEENYIEDDFVKIEMHKKIQNIQKIQDIYDLLDEFSDRFGKVNPELEIYMYEKLFEVNTVLLEVEKITETKTNISLTISEEGSKKMAGDDLFSSGMKVSDFLRFTYKDNKIHIILDTVGLEKHWLFTMVEFLESILSKKK
jgi:transcription-repair coupling factor (superfamily II helicase)